MTDYEFVFSQDNSELVLVSYDKDGNVENKEVLSQDFAPVELSRDVDTGEIAMKLEVLYRDKLVSRVLTLDKLKPMQLAEYVKYGYPFSDARVRRCISEWLFMVQDELPLVETTKGVGWKKMEEYTYFQLSHSISTTKEVHVEYKGDLLINTAGSLKDYCEFLIEAVMPNIQTQAVVAFSVSSALATYLDNDLTLILHMCGQSTTGKTTMLQLAASVWGSAKRCSNGVLQTWNATNNAVINTLCGCHGITMCFDELGASDDDAKTFLSMVYKMSMGIDKKRLGYDNVNQSFAVNICSSGEIPIKVVEEVNGVDVRLLEIDFPWTESKEHAELIKSVLNSCYGRLGAFFVKRLMKIPKSALKAKLEEIVEQITVHHKENLEGLTDKNRRVFQRMIQKVAVVALTALLLKKFLKLDFDSFGIAEFLIKNSRLLDMPDDEHIQFLETYLNALAEERRYLKKQEKQAGFPLYPSDFIKDEYLIKRSESFYDLMKTKGYNRKECRHHLQKLKKRGFLHTETGKLYNRRRFTGETCACIEIRLDKLDEEKIYYPCWRSEEVKKHARCDR